MESNEDLVQKYKHLIQSEKRRLNDVDFKFSMSTDDNNKSDKCNENSLSLKSQSQSESSQMPKTLSNERNNVLKETPRSSPKNMEQWVTDTFYSSFPSYSKQSYASQKLADDRRQEYKRYLTEISNKKLLNAPKTDTEFTEYKRLLDSKNNKISTRNKLIDDLKHSDLPFNFLSPDAIEERNEKVAAERARKKIELQQELVRQIEEKKLELEKLRAKEKEDDAILTRKLENQLKALQLDEELRKKKCSPDKAILVNPNSSRMHVAPEQNYVTENCQPSLTTERKSNSENGRSRLTENDDRQLYKFFSNSAPHNNHISEFNEPRSALQNKFSINTQTHNSSTFSHMNHQCIYCQSLVPMLCSSCCHLNHKHCCSGYNLLTNMDVCNNCRLAWIQSWYNSRATASGPCCINHSPHNFAEHLKQPQVLEIAREDQNHHLLSENNVRLGESPPKPVVNVNERNNRVRVESNLPATNIEKTETELSMRDKLSASTDDELNELKRKNEMLIAKYAQNYGSLRKRRPSNKKETNLAPSDDSFPLPLMREHLTTAEPKSKSVEKTDQSEAVKNLGYKWEIPIVQKQVIDRPSKVLTQIGAIAKQLQLEKLNFNDS